MASFPGNGTPYRSNIGVIVLNYIVLATAVGLFCDSYMQRRLAYKYPPLRRWSILYVSELTISKVKKMSIGSSDNAGDKVGGLLSLPTWIEITSEAPRVPLLNKTIIYLVIYYSDRTNIKFSYSNSWLDKGRKSSRFLKRMFTTGTDKPGTTKREKQCPEKQKRKIICIRKRDVQRLKQRKRKIICMLLNVASPIPWSTCTYWSHKTVTKGAAHQRTLDLSAYILL